MACEALGLFPRNRIPVDFQEARKKFKSLATQFHPDRNDGSEDMRKQYQAAVEAWEIVKDYMEQLKRNGSKKK